LCPKKRAPNDPNLPFKEKEKKGGERSQLGGQWKVPMFGGLWKVLLLGGPWKVPLLSGQWKRRRWTFSSLPTFPPTNFI
jgi:hypothetical protein